MCGIAGVLNNGGAGVSLDAVRDMIGVLRHRGPDDCGFHAEQNVALGHARLSIIDIAGGKQPMSSSDGRLWITFNGEIFNYIELREQLKRKGHTFRTRSDTEVILHLYEENGVNCVRELNGQWAFAIWDGRKRALFLSRDRAGVRPLFYTVTNDSFLFASEIKALFTRDDVVREFDLLGLDQVFTYWVTLPPRTVFKNVLELPPAHCMTVQDGAIRTWRYWELDYNCEKIDSERLCAEQLFDLLLDATRIRLRSDVPVGAYVSGGLDSAVVAALIQRVTGTRANSFSVSFQDPDYDEGPYQKEAARAFGANHYTIHSTYDDICRVFPEVVWHAEAPLLRTAPAPFYALSEVVRSHNYKVVLTGEGADEVLAGYDIFKETKIRRFCIRQPASRLRPLLLRRLYPYMPKLQRQPQSYLRSFFRIEPGNLDNPFFSHQPRWELTSGIRALYSRTFREQVADRDQYDELSSMLPAGYESWDPLCKAQWLEWTLLLPGYILSSQGDRMSMAHSVEGRFPFLDYRISDFAASLSPRLKMKVLDEKHLLKVCAADLIPAAIRRRHKQPYRAPDAVSFVGPGNEFRQEYVRELLSERQIADTGIFDPPSVARLLAKVRTRSAGVRDNMAFVAVLSTQLVSTQFLQAFLQRGASHAAIGA